MRNYLRYVKIQKSIVSRLQMRDYLREMMILKTKIDSRDRYFEYTVVTTHFLRRYYAGGKLSLPDSQLPSYYDFTG